MAEREIIPRLPTSGQIIGALVARLGIRHDRLRGSTAQCYFSGDPERLVRDSSREEVIATIAEVLTGSGFIAASEKNEGGKPAERLASMLIWHAHHWDLSRSFLRPRLAHVLPSNLPKVWNAYIRTAVIDLAFRVAAHLQLSGSDPASLRLLGYASRSTRGDYLNQKRRQAGLSLETLAQQVDVTNNTVDAWMYHGARPIEGHLEKLAKVLAENIEGSTAPAIALELRSLYWISEVASLLTQHIGAEAVSEGIERLHRYTEAVHGLIDEHFPAEGRAEALTALADLGSGANVAEPLLAALIREEADAEWRKDLGAIGIDWIRRVVAVNVDVNQAEVAELIDETGGQLLKDWDVSNPEAYAHYRRGQELQAQGKLREALAEVEIAARLDPLDPANHFTIGSVKTGLGLRDGDAELVDRGLSALWLAATLDPRWIVPWTEIGVTLLQLGRPDEALAHLQNVEPDRGPLDSRYFSALGTVYWNLDQLSDALASYQSALEIDPEEPNNLLAAAEVALTLGNRENHRRYSRIAHHFGVDEDTDRFLEMVREFEKIGQDGVTADQERQIAVMDAAIKLNPDDDYAYLRRASAHFRKGNEESAISDLNTVLRLNPDQAVAYWIRAVLWQYRAEWERMIADLSEVIRLGPEDADAHYRRAIAHGEKSQWDHALADICEAIRLDPHLADAYRLRGDLYRYTKECDGSIGDFDTALRLDPDNAAALLGRGAAYRMMGNLKQAVSDYDQAISLRPGDSLSYRFRGDAHVAKGDYELGVADFSRALNLNPDDPIAYFHRANAHLFSDNLDQALADFDETLKMNPANGRATYGRGLAKEMMGDKQGAEEDYQKARDPGFDVGENERES